MTTTGNSKPTPLGANYAKLFAANTISNLGDGIGMIAYPWLASAITRNPILIAAVVVAQRLPWLLFSLPAGVITDRRDRRSLMVGANVIRAVLTMVIAVVVLGRQGVLPGPDEVESVAADQDLWLYGILLVATLFLGMAEVLHDNAAQTFLPAIVEPDGLEKANGRLWGAEQVANTFVGPPFGALLLAIAFSVPFFVDAATFAVAAFLVLLIPAASRRSSPAEAPEPQTEASRSWTAEVREGFGWLWRHELLRPLAIILGLLNMFGALSWSIMVLYAQEVLETSATEFALLGTGGALGGVVGGWTAPWVSRKIGAGPSLMLTLVGGAVTTAVIGLTSTWPVVWLMSLIFIAVATLWNVITVSLRQTIIPDHLLGRVNSVYRFFAWGGIPLGALVGGIIVAVSERFGSRELALRMPWFFGAAGPLTLIPFALRKLTTERIETARAGTTDSSAEVDVS